MADGRRRVLHLWYHGASCKTAPERLAAEQGSRADNYARGIEAMQLNVLAELRARHAAESKLDKLTKNGTAHQESEKTE